MISKVKILQDYYETMSMWQSYTVRDMIERIPHGQVRHTWYRRTLRLLSGDPQE